MTSRLVNNLFKELLTIEEAGLALRAEAKRCERKSESKW